MSSTRWSDSAGKMRSANFTAAAAIEMDALPMSVVRTYFLGDCERALEQPIQHQAKRARGFRGAHRLFHLAEDLRLTQHHRIQSRCDAKSVRHRLVVGQCVQVGRKCVGGKVMRGTKPPCYRLRRTAVKVHLGAIAGGQDRRFLDHRAPVSSRSASASRSGANATRSRRSIGAVV